MTAILFCGLTYGQTNNIAVDRDSLFKVFTNYEGCKLERNALQADKINLTEILALRKAQLQAYDSIVKNYETVIVPQYEERDSLRQMETKNEKKLGKKKARKNLGIGIILGAAIGIVIMAL